MRKVRLTFDQRYREAILSGGKSATIRHGLDRAIEPGDALWMLTPEDEHFATGHVTAVWQATAFDVAETEIDGHRAYRDVFGLLDHLRPFYPDATLTPNTDLTVVEWREAHEPGTGRFCEMCRVPMTRTRYQG
jgi:hypothetical protein